MTAAGGDPVLHGVVELDGDALPGGPLRYPTRSLLRVTRLAARWSTDA